MTDSLEIFAVRHGETTWNRDRRIQGHKDAPLSDVGREQARDLAERIADLRLDAAISSDLSRARETATLALGARPIELALDAGFRERGFGTLEGLTWRDARQRYPERSDPRLAERIDSELGVEDYDGAFGARVRASLGELPRRFPKARRLLLVTHGGVIKLLLAHATGAKKTFIVSNCSLFRFRLEASGQLRFEDRRSKASEAQA